MPKSRPPRKKPTTPSRRRASRQATRAAPPERKASPPGKAAQAPPPAARAPIGPRGDDDVTVRAGEPLDLHGARASAPASRSAWGGQKPGPAAPPPATGPSTPPGAEPAGPTLPIEVDPAKVEETLGKLKDEVVHWAKKGRYTQVRFKFRGKPVLPDIPLAALVAVEGVTFYWGGLLRMLIFNLAGKAVLDVELVNESEKVVQKGKEKLLSGDLLEATALFEKAARMDRDNPHAHLNLGIAHKLAGRTADARAALEKARALAQDGPLAQEAARLLAGLPKTP